MGRLFLWPELAGEEKVLNYFGAEAFVSTIESALILQPPPSFAYMRSKRTDFKR